jgi:ribose-phosphate pyrophosphokinase
MQRNESEIKIFAGSYGIPFAKRMCDYLGVELGSSEVIHFSDGNTFVRIKEMVRDKDVYLVESIGMDPNNSFAEILFWLDAFKRASANSVTCVIPYFSYAKGDKKDEPRVSIRARVCADSIELAGADRVIMLDLHSPQVQGFFKIPLDHLTAMPILSEYAKKRGLIDENTVIVSPDAGFAKDARKYAEYLDLKLAIGDKSRVDHSERAKCMNIFGDVEGKNCVIVDDFSLSAGTLKEVAVALKQKGAKHIYAFLSHIVLTEKGVNTIENESPIELLIGTDSVVNSNILKSDMIEVVSIAPLFGEAVKRIHTRTSIGEMFKKIPPKVLEEL